MITKLLLAYNKTMVEFVRYILYKNTVRFLNSQKMKNKECASGVLFFLMF